MAVIPDSDIGYSGVVFITLTISEGGLYDIVAAGAQGGGEYGGLGAVVGGEFALSAGQQLEIIVGGQGAGTTTNGSGGGGGTFVMFDPGVDDPLLIAGGGGGSGAGASSIGGAGGQAPLTNIGFGASGDGNFSSFGQGGLGGGAGGGGGGGGLYSGGGVAAFGIIDDGGGDGGGGYTEPLLEPFANPDSSGGPAAPGGGDGGFGGGGGGGGDYPDGSGGLVENAGGGGGGGGYSGGAGGDAVSAGNPGYVGTGGGGGQSYDAASMDVQTGYNVGDGGVSITLMPQVTFKTLFSGGDGAHLIAGLSVDAAGDVLGTTSGRTDTVFEIANSATGYAGTPVTLTNLDNQSGYATSDLLADAAGDLFGTTAGNAGVGPDGTVFELAKTATGYASTSSVVASFDGTDGDIPEAGLAADSAGDLFGTTAYGGASDDGTVFEITKTGGGYESTPTPLVSFNLTDGGLPEAGLIVDAAGDLFGTTFQGGAYGANGYGTVFEIVKTSTGYESTPTTLFSFNSSDGVRPDAGLIADAAGDLFGTASNAGPYNDGTVFEIKPIGGSYAMSSLDTLVSFYGSGVPVILGGAGGTGAAPQAGLLIDAAGDLFGTTYSGGANDDGTVFEVVASNGGYLSTPVTLYSFDGTDGANPAAGLTNDAAGDLFGTTETGGTNGDGTAFELSNAGFQVAPPVLSGGSNSVNYTPLGLAVAIDAGLGVSDETTTSLAGATISIAAGFLAGDTLTFTNQNDIAGSYTSTTGVLTLTGGASLADYQSALDSITFGSTSDNPSNSGSDPTRTVSWTVTDGTLSSNAVTSTIQVVNSVNPAAAGGSPDFTGDGMSDILWQNTNGTVAEWQMNGGTIAASAAIANVTPGSGWSIAGYGDFTGDGMSDILWQNANGTVAEWQMNGSTIAASAAVADVPPGSGWSIAGIGDFTGNGMSDILWQNTNGTVAEWQMNGSTIASSATVANVPPGSGWSIAGIGDFNGDGMSDILWQNTNGTVAEWQMNGGTIASSATIANVAPGSGWSIAGIGDFNGDGMSDILWQNTNGAVAEWQMNGSTIASSQAIAYVPPGSGWSIAGVGDFTGDGKSDILWQNTNGTVVEWLMNGYAISATPTVASVNPASGWSIQESPTALAVHA